jgi:hypothetical protein
MTFVWVWLVLGVLAGIVTVERLGAMLASASKFPGISVVGIAEVLIPGEAMVFFLLRWWELRSRGRRRWRWLLLAAFSSFLTLFLVGAATLASRPGGLTPAGILVVLVGTAITAFAWWRSGHR